MQSMTAADAADTHQDPPPDESGGWVGQLFGGLWDWAVGLVPGGPLTLIGATFAVAVLADQLASPKKGRDGKTNGEKADQVLTEVITGLFRGLWLLARLAGRFAAGRELWGEKKTDATFWDPGTPPQKPEKAPEAVMGAVAAAPPRVSLAKRRRPGRWAQRTAAWIDTYSGRGAAALDVTIRAAMRTAAAAGTTWRALATAGRATARVTGHIAHALRTWHCWPYALRALARVALVGTVAGLAVPAWRIWTIAALILALAAIVALAALYQPPTPGDDAVYGPRLWVLLRQDLKLGEDEQREDWLVLPKDVGADGARITLRLPWTFRGTQTEKETITALVSSRVPGEWVGRFAFKCQHATATFTHKPPPPAPEPDPEPPAKVDLFGRRIQDAIDAAQTKPETYVFGIDEQDEIVEIPLVGEQAHVAVSVGTGGGKSALLQMLATQVIRRRGTILAVDPKMVSLRLLKGLEGVYLYDDPGQGLDMRRALEWAAEVVEARFYEYLSGKRNFPPLFVYLEESNELTGILKAVWMKVKDKDEPNQDPIWESVASILRKGRQVNVHVVAVFQDLRDTDFSGVSLGLLFPVKIMGAYVKKQWDRIVGSNVAMPPSERKAGRLVGVKNGVAFRFQSPYAIVDDPEMTKDEKAEEAERQIREHCKELRARHGWDSAGLYAPPPAPSPRHVPTLLSRDAGPQGAQGPWGGDLSDETAGQLSRNGADVTASDGRVTASGDTRQLIPGQAQAGAPEPAQDPTAPPELLPLSEVARRLDGVAGVPAYATMRQHKSRRDEFPKGVEKNGREFFTVSQIRAYYVLQQEQA